jgi:hypothetical protein
MLINGCDIRIIHASTGELIRELILNPALDYQTQGLRKPRPKPRIRGSRCFLCLVTPQLRTRRDSNPRYRLESAKSGLFR